jgi:hypothetical protein
LLPKESDLLGCPPFVDFKKTIHHKSHKRYTKAGNENLELYIVYIFKETKARGSLRSLLERKITQSYQIRIQGVTFSFTNLICENLCCLRYLRAFDTTTLCAFCGVFFCLGKIKDNHLNQK